MWVSFLMWPTFHVCVFLFSCCSVVQDLMPSLTSRLHFGHHLNAPRTEKWRLPCMFIARCVVWMYGGGSRLVMCLCFVGNQVWVHLLPLLRWAETTDINLFVDLLCITVSWWDLVVAWELRLWCVVCDRDVGVHAQASASYFDISTFTDQPAMRGISSVWR